jgi:hypothetical protein
MEVDDPWTWSVDRVVQEFCTHNRSWESRTTTASIHDPAQLEGVLREHEITGSVLLVDVDRDVLKHDFGITKLGRISYLLAAIKDLRLRSAIYQAEMLQTQLNGVASSVPSAPGFGHAFAHARFDPTSPFGQLQLQRNILAGQPHHGPQPFLIPYSPTKTISPQNVTDSSTPATPADGGVAPTPGVVMASPDSNKRRRLDLTDPANNMAFQQDNQLLCQITPVEPTGQLVQAYFPQDVDMLPGRHSTSPTPESNTLKRRRISPTLVDTVPTPGSAVSREVSLSAVTAPYPTPGVAFIGQDGRKRLVPIHQPTSDADKPNDSEALFRSSYVPEGEAPQEAAERNSHIARPSNTAAVADYVENCYLGKDKMPVDDIFYKDVAVGEELSGHDAPDFHGRFSSGKRLYVNKIMKHFLRAQREDFLRDGKLFSAVLPYALKLAPKHRTPSFTLYYSDKDHGIRARRETLRAWPEVNPEASMPTSQTDAGDNSFAFNLGSWEAYEKEFDPDALEKWKDVAGGDELLPIYGESDEENEYDPETWAEIEEEQGTLERPERLLKKSLLSKAEIDQAIDEGIQEMVTKWRGHELPKKERKAYRIWNIMRHRENRQARLQSIQAQLSRIENDRLPKIRKEIVGEKWTSQAQVRKQTRVMEQSIFDQQGLLWEISVIESQTVPDKPPPKFPSSKKSSVVLNDHDEDGESLGSDSEDSSSDEDAIDDFIVEDPPISEEQFELNFADSEGEGEDSASSSGSSSSMHRQTITLSRKKAVDEDASDLEPAIFNTISHTPFRGSSKASATSPRATSPKTPIKKSPREASKLRRFSEIPSNTASTAIDLTMTSSDEVTRVSRPRSEVIDLVTPTKQTPKIRLINRNSPFNSSGAKSPIVVLEGEASVKPDKNNLPSLSNPAAVAKFSSTDWANLPDVKRLLITVLYSLDANLRNMIFSVVANITKVQLWSNITEVSEALLRNKKTVQGIDEATFRTLVHITRLFHMFTDTKERNFTEPPKRVLKKLQTRRDSFPAFYELCRKFEGYFNGKSQMPGNDTHSDEDEDSDEGPQRATKRRRPVK